LKGHAISGIKRDNSKYSRRKALMANLLNYLWIILLALYILSPLDAHPLFIDDLIASAALFYLLYKNVKQKKQKGDYYSTGHSREYKRAETEDTLSLEEAYNLLGLNTDASWEEVKKAYKEKIAKSHPDKVSHLSKELQDKARELTLKLNNAIEIIKHNRIR
jgi:uncharacterized membrane protein YkvA (DUF1232 family)